MAKKPAEEPEQVAPEADAEETATEPEADEPAEGEEGDSQETAEDESESESPFDRWAWLAGFSKKGLDPRQLERQYAGDFTKAMESFVNAHHMVGERNEDAALTKQLREQIGAEGLQSLLSSLPSAKRDERPKTAAEYVLLMQKAAAEGASPELKERAAQVEAELWDWLVSRAFGPDGQQSAKEIEKLAAELEDVKTTLAQSSQQTEEDRKKAEWTQRHAHELSSDGKPTMLCAKTEEMHHKHPDCQDLEYNSLIRWKLAFALAKAEQPKPNKTRAVSRTAMHQPNAASGSLTKAQLYKQLREQGASDEEILKKVSALTE